jgi:hypothetical protein
VFSFHLVLKGLLDGVDMLTWKQSVTPFPPSSSQQGAGQQVEVPGTPWWMPNAADPSAIPQVSCHLGKICVASC